MRSVAVLLVALAATAPAAAQRLDVEVRPGLTVADLESLAERGAVGLLVPDAGPETSAARARASLLRGEVRNSLRGEPPSGPVLIELGRAGREGVIVLALPRGGEQRNDRRYPIAVVAPGFRGLLTSESTRIPGLVSIADVAPTALGRRLGSTPADDPVGELRALDERIRDNGTARLPATLLAYAAVVLLALAVPRAALPALAAVLAVNLLLGALGLSEPWLTIPALALASALALALPLRAVGPALAGVVAAYLLAMAVDPAWVALSPLGPTQNARFYGISNLLETLLLPAVLGGAWLLGRRFGWTGFAAVGALGLVTVAGSRFGADGGGAVVLAAGLAALAAARSRRVAVAVAVIAVAAIALDALAGPSTHVGESLRGGPASLATDLAERVSLSWERATAGWGVGLATLAALGALALLVARGARHPLPLALAFAIAVSMLVNDSPQDVAAGGLVGYLALERFALGRAEQRTPSARAARAIIVETPRHR